IWDCRKRPVAEFAKMKIKTLILAGGTALITFAGASWYFSSVIILSQKHSVEQDRINLKLNSPADFGLPQPESVVIPTRSGHISAWLFRNPSGKKCAAILHHGHTGTRWGGLKYARLFFERGCAALSVDGRYHGESSGDFCTYGYYDRYDMVDVAAWLKKELVLRDSEVGMMGESLGGAVSLLTAAETTLAFVAADSPFSNASAIFHEQAEKQYGPAIRVLIPVAFFFAEKRANFKIKDVSPMDAAPKITAPVFLVHSLQDDYTSPYHSELIYKAVSHDRKVLHLTDRGAKHGKSIDMNYAEYKKWMDEFLSRYTHF
ncbi:MAG TPA: alpha/beta fold hydrolase, partial [Leptospiraceae bacterium]|nr:alpha/beta fold hydrolase [Leptospiraceae bacterium]